MKIQATGLQVTAAADGVRPQAFGWQGRTVRVMAIEDVRVLGIERRYRVVTAEGPYELGFDFGAGSWTLHRAPSWLARARAQWENLPRYPLPTCQRRTRPARWTLSVRGGNHAGRLAVVRQ